MFRRYPEYKHTPALWIDEIPVTWQSRKVSELFSERRIKVSDSDYQALSVCKAGIVPQLNTAVKTDNGDNRKLVKTGDFVINSRSDRKGSSGISPLDGSVSLINIVLKLRSDDNRTFLHYLLRSYLFVEEYYRNGRGLVADLWTTRYSELRNIFLPVPPRPEQDQIVYYIGWQWTEINRFIKTKRKEIRRLQELKRTAISNVVTHGLNCNSTLKRSGIAWIPDIPAYWDIKRAKYMFNKQNRPVSDSDGVVTCFRDGVVTLRANRRTTGFTESIQETGYQGVRKGDLVIHVMDAFAGSIGVSDSDGKSTPVYNVCTPKGDYNNYYYSYLLREMARTSYIQSLYRGIRERSSDFKFDVFAQQYLIIPPRNEQDAIVEYLDAFTAKIDTMIAAINNEISHIIEYRTRLISDVVTGKVDVRNIEIPALEADTSEDVEIDEVSDDEDLDDDFELDNEEEMEVNEDDDN